MSNALHKFKPASARRRLVMHAADRLTQAEANVLLYLLECHDKPSSASRGAHAKIKRCLARAQEADNDKAYLIRNTKDRAMKPKLQLVKD